MPAKISWAAIVQAQGAIAWRDLVADLGHLAPYCLAERVLQITAELENDPGLAAMPTLDRQSGNCWALCVTADHRVHDVMRPGFVLPVRWSRRATTDPRLPADLRRVADDVRRAVGTADSRVADFRLGWPDELHWPDLGDWSGDVLSADSAFPALLAGLIAAVNQQPSQPDVWATGQWRDGAGICAVDGIAQKVDEVLRWPVRELFVPQDNVAEARKAAADRLIVRPFPASGADVHVVMNPLLAAWLIEPLREFSAEELHRHDESEKLFEELAEYHRKLQNHNDQARAEEFYERRLLPLIALRCRDRLTRRGTPPPKTEGLVAIASHQPETIRTAVAVFQPTKCLILYTTEESAGQSAASSMRSYAEKAAAWCRGLDCEPRFAELAYDEPRPDFRQQLAADLRARIAEFRRQLGGGPLGVELTPGTTMMKLALVQAVVEPGDWLVCLHHEKIKLPSGKPVVRHGTEGYLVWRSSDGW